MAGISVADLLNQANSFKDGADAVSSKLLDISQAQQDISDSDASIYQVKATDDTTVAAAKNAGQLQTQSNIQKAGAIFGTDLGAQNEQLTKLSLASQAAFDTKQSALNTIKQKESVGFLDDPLGFIMNKFTINSDIDQYNVAEATESNINNRIQTINQNTQTTAITQNALTQTMTAASADAATRSAAAVSTLEAHKSQQQGLAYNAQGIQAALASTQAGLSAEFQANTAKNTETTIGIAQANLKLAQDNAAMARTEFLERQQTVADTNAFAASYVDTINKGRQVRMGDAYAPLDPSQSKLIVATLKNKGSLGDSLQADYSIGERSNVAGVNMIGTSPAQTIDIMSKAPVSLTPLQQTVKDNILGRAVSDLKAAQQPGTQLPAYLRGVNFKDKDAITVALNQRAQELLDTDAKVVKPGDATNPYQISSIGDLAAASPTIANLPTYQAVLKPLVDKGASITDPAQVMDLVGKAVAGGLVDHNTAARDIATMYQMGVKTNLATRNLAGFGLKPTLAYNASVTTDPAALFSKTGVINMTDVNAVSRTLVRVNSQNLASNFNPALPLLNISNNLGNSILGNIRSNSTNNPNAPGFNTDLSGQSASGKITPASTGNP